MRCSLWNQAQGRSPWNDNWPNRCDLCGRRIKCADYASVFVGKTDTAIVIHEICYQHGGRHADCLRGIEVDFGRGRSWSAIWASNLLDELIFWLKSAVWFVRLVLALSLHIMIHPVRYYRYRQKMRELGMDGGL